MLSITRNTSKNQFDYSFDPDAFAQAHGFRDEAHFNHTAELIASSYALWQLEREIEDYKIGTAKIEAELEAMK